ncbi:Zn-ribbon domain-containing OB-fold protein [Persicimonas caeni]|nr:zinc ribbon domain-containing protein [Persicimonas caeni]
MNEALVASSPNPTSSNPMRAAAGHTYLCVTDLYEQQLRQGNLVAAQCVSCSQHHFPPTDLCPHCQSAHMRPLALSGRGRLCSAEIAASPEELSLGRILLEEGIHVRALLVGAFRDPQVLRASLAQKPVEVTPAVLSTCGVTILAFKPA